MVCYRVTPDHAETRLAGDHYAILEAEMEKHTLKLDKPICPHQGTPLGGIKPKDGIIHCPLHGLGFCSKTGKLVRKTKAFTDKYGFGPSPWNSAEPVEEKERQASCH
jgi:nitrite reductase/ring-hydroxylating ferredoxin subunit